MTYNFILDFCHKIIGCLSEKYVCRTDMRMSGRVNTVYDVTRKEEEAYRCAKSLRVWVGKERIRVTFGLGHNLFKSRNEEIIISFGDPQLNEKLLAAVDKLMEEVLTIDEIFKQRW